MSGLKKEPFVAVNHMYYIITTLDWYNGFLRITVAEESIKNTVFVMLFWLYELTQMVLAYLRKITSTLNGLNVISPCLVDGIKYC